VPVHKFGGKGSWQRSRRIREPKKRCKREERSTANKKQRREETETNKQKSVGGGGLEKVCAQILSCFSEVFLLLNFENLSCFDLILLALVEKPLSQTGHLKGLSLVWER